MYGNFYILLALIAIHIASSIVTEFREEGAVITAMFTGRKIHGGDPVECGLMDRRHTDDSDVD
jgi:cytochrome b